jgi:hypothetical protein
MFHSPVFPIVQGDKLRRFHICLDKILEDVVAMQKDGFPLMLKLLEHEPPFSSHKDLPLETARAITY